MKELKRQVDEEIRRDILAGKLEVPVPSHKRTNLTTINVKNDASMSNKKDFLNMSAVDSKAFMQNYISKGDISMALSK
jgi:hypothetical protein